MAPFGTSDRVALTAAVVAPIAAAVALTPLRGHLDTADDGLLLVVVIVAVATSGRRLAAMVAAIVAVLSFDFFLTRPYQSFRITRSADLISEILLLVVGLAVGDLAARGRRARNDAHRSTDELIRLHLLTEMVAAGEEPHLVAMAASHQLTELLSLRGCRFTPSTTEVMTSRVTPGGDVTVGREYWPTGDLGLPTKAVYLPVRGNGRLCGYLVMTPTPGHLVPHQRLVVAVAIADQLGASLATDHSLSFTR
jgi:K+-sensing histidine kinase KdpD